MRPQRHEAISDDPAAQGIRTSPSGATGRRLVVDLDWLDAMPASYGPGKRLTLLVLRALEQRDGEATPSHRKLGKLVGHSAKSSQRTAHALSQDDELAIEPCFWSDDHQQTSNSYAVLARPPEPVAEHPDRLSRARDRVANQQKEISEETVVRAAAPVDNPTPVDNPSSEVDLTAEDRAALAVVGRGLKFPRPENLPEPEAGSPCAEVLKRWGWDAYGDVWGVLQGREALAAPAAVPLALEALLRRPPGSVDTPGAYLRGSLKHIVKAGGAGGPGLRATRPAPDTPAGASSLRAQLATLAGMKSSCLGDPRRLRQIEEALYKLGRQIVAEEARAS